MKKDEDGYKWLEIYAIYDKKSEKFDTPFFAHNDVFAKRRYLLMAEEERSPLSMWPEDFALFKVGRFNVDTAVVIEEHENVLEGAAAIRKEMPQNSTFNLEEIKQALKEMDNEK